MKVLQIRLCLCGVKARTARPRYILQDRQACIDEVRQCVCCSIDLDVALGFDSSKGAIDIAVGRRAIHQLTRYPLAVFSDVSRTYMPVEIAIGCSTVGVNLLLTQVRVNL
ncbi:hypothetical protein [Roseibium sediminis]|uniref:hypothetical protein n=1 Tax=Roseibium sediminis TaxID=1775174 RepID=UPI00123DB585|nr:hypothetical protein [Roseibium sediminis]